MDTSVSAQVGSGPTPPPSVDAAANGDGKSAPVIVGPLEHLSLHVLLRDIVDRLNKVEEGFSKTPVDSKSYSATALEVIRLVLGGWTAFAFLFLLLFYAPLREALQSIPDKIRNATEVSVPGVTLKSTIQTVAASEGLAGLGESIPRLSSTALQLLMRVPRNGEGLISYIMVPGSETMYSAFSLPSDSAISALAELQRSGFVQLESLDSGRTHEMTGEDLQRAIADLRQRFPGDASTSYQEFRTEWRLHQPVPRSSDIPSFMWRLSDSGSNAVAVLLKSVSAALVDAQPQ